MKELIRRQKEFAKILSVSQRRASQIDVFLDLHKLRLRHREIPADTVPIKIILSGGKEVEGRGVFDK